MQPARTIDLGHALAQPASVRIGAWSAIFGVLAIQIAVLAVTLALAGGNRRANRLLAGALVVIAGMMTPFVIGYAGAYDTWPWLTFAPFAVPLALGPLLYGHLFALVHGRAPDWRPGWRRNSDSRRARAVAAARRGR